MGKRGPKPKPTTLKRLEGNPGKRPLNDLEPIPVGDLPPCPERLQGIAREAYDRIAAEQVVVGVAKSSDAMIVEIIAEQWERYVSAVTANDNREVDLALKHLFRGLPELGMTPSARSRLQVAPLDSNKEPDILEFVKRKTA